MLAAASLAPILPERFLLDPSFSWISIHFLELFLELSVNQEINRKKKPTRAACWKKEYPRCPQTAIERARVERHLRVVVPPALSRRDRRGTRPLDLSSTPSSRESAVTSRVLPAVVSRAPSLGVLRHAAHCGPSEGNTVTRRRRVRKLRTH